MMPPDTLVEGGPPPGAGWLNQLVAFAQSVQLSVDPTSGLVSTAGTEGTALAVQRTPELWIKLTFAHGDGSYSWVEQIPIAGGNWRDGFVKGFCGADGGRGSGVIDPAWEANSYATLPTGYIVEATRDHAVGRLSFRGRACS